MGAMDKLMGGGRNADEPAAKMNPMEAMLMGVLEKVGLNRDALMKVQADVVSFISFVTVSLNKGSEDRKLILENQAKILADLALLLDKENPDAELAAIDRVEQGNIQP